MLSGLDLLKGTSTQPTKTGLDLLQGTASIEGKMQVKTGLSLLDQQVVTEAPTTVAPLAKEPIHPATAYLEKFTKPSIEEFDKYQMAPLITAENVAPAMDTLGRLWNLAQHPYDVVKGAAVFASEIPGFIGGLASAIGTVPIEILKGGTVLDWYNASAKNMQAISGLWHQGVSAPLGKLMEMPEKMGEELAQTMFGAELEVRKDEAELVGEIFMVPYTASSAPLHAMADSPTWDDHPNVRGILKFTADALGLVTMGLVLKGGPVMASRRAEPIVKRAHDIDTREKAIEASGLDEVLKVAQKKVLDAEKVQLELEIESLKKELDHEKMAKENLKEKGKEVEGIKEGIEVEGIRDERLKFAEERAKEIPEEKVKTGIKLIKKMPPKPPELIDDLAINAIEKIGNAQVRLNENNIRRTAKKLAEGDRIKELEIRKRLREEALINRKSAMDDLYRSLEPEFKLGDIVEVELSGIQKKTKVEITGAYFDISQSMDQQMRTGFPASFRFENLVGKDVITGESIEIYPDYNINGKRLSTTIKRDPEKILVQYIDLKKDRLKIEPTEPITNLDLQTGTKEPPSLSTESSPFRETPEHTQAMKDVYAERAEAVRNNPELMTNKLLNDVNRWLDGEELPVEKAKNDLSELAARAEELEKSFVSRSDFLHWKDTVSSAATWARNADRAKIERPLPSVDLNIMVPLDQIPEMVRKSLASMKQFKDRIFDKKGLFVKDIYRNEELFSDTGFWLGKDGFWRYEINDKDASFVKSFLPPKPGYTSIKVGTHKLGDIYKHPELYENFPHLKNTDVVVTPSLPDGYGAYYAAANRIEISNMYDVSLAKRVLSHELQHAVNEEIGAFRGTNIETAGRKAYREAPGEMEARLTEARQSMSLEERTEIPPWETLGDMLPREGIRRDVGTKLYSGLPVDEAVKQLKSMAKHTGEFMKEFKGSFKEKEFDFAHAVKQVKADTLRSLWDQSETLLNIVKNKYPEEYNRVVSRQRSAVTGIGYGKVLYGQAVKEIYGGKSKEMIEAINAYVLARRFKDIYGYRTEKGYKHQPGYGSAQTISTSAMIEMIKDIPEDIWVELDIKAPEIKKLFGKITPTEMADVVKAGDAYFEWSRKIVDDLVESGIKSPEEGVLLKAHDFRKFKTMLIKKLYDFNYDLQLKGETIKVSNSGVLELGSGSSKIIEPDSRIVLSEQMARAYGSIAHQAAALEWKGIADRHPDNGFVSIKRQGGWSPIPYMADGVRKNIYFHLDAIKYLVTRSRDISPRLAMVVRGITLAPVTRALAVGLSPIWSTFIGLPMDIMHSLWAARTWEADAKGVRPKASFPFYETKEGKFKKVYSPFAGVDALQIGLDMKRTLGDVYGRGPLTENLMKHGLVMNFLTQRQNRYMKGVKPPGDWAKMMDLLSYHGLSMELWARVATADRVIRRDAKKLGITYEQALKNDDIMYRAAHAGRDRMDYNQGGWIVKALDQSGIIFLNAAVLGTRTFWRQAVDNPVDFAFRTAQLGITAAGVTAAAWSLYPETMKDMSTQGNKRDVTWPIAPNWLRVKDRDGNDISFYFKLRMDPNAAFLYRIFEGLTRTYMYDQGLIKEEPDYKELVKILKHLGPVDVKLPPGIQAWIDYTTNYSWWKDRQMYTQMGGKTLDWPKSQFEGMYDERVPQMAKDIGAATKLSPARLAGTVSNVIPSNNEFVWLMGKGYEEAFSDLPEEVRKQHWLVTLAEVPGFNRVVGITRHGRGRWKVKSDIENEVELEQMVRNSKFDMLAKQNAWYGVKNKEKLLKFMNEQDFDVHKDMIDTFKFIKDPMVKALPHRDFWLSMRHMSIEGRAKTWVELLEKSSESEKVQLLGELNQVMLIGGVVTSEFMKEVSRLRLGHEQSKSKEGPVDMLKRHEELRLEKYKDSMGKATIGYGHLIKPGETLTRITKDEAESILRKDIAIAENAVDKFPEKILSNLNPRRKEVLVNMAFNLGAGKLRKFKRMFAAIEQQDFDLASQEILKSKYAKQVGTRANELAKIMQRGY